MSLFPLVAVMIEYHYTWQQESWLEAKVTLLPASGRRSSKRWPTSAEWMGFCYKWSDKQQPLLSVRSERGLLQQKQDHFTPSSRSSWEKGTTDFYTDCYTARNIFITEIPSNIVKLFQGHAKPPLVTNLIYLNEAKEVTHQGWRHRRALFCQNMLSKIRKHFRWITFAKVVSMLFTEPTFSLN